MSAAGSGRDRDGFEARLAEFLLVAFAGGHRVEGQWYLVETDELVPDMAVEITRNDAEPATSGSAEFPDELRAFLLTEFAEGADVVGSWEIEYVPDEFPSWTVEIELDTEDATDAG